MQKFEILESFINCFDLIKKMIDSLEEEMQSLKKRVSELENQETQDDR